MFNSLSGVIDEVTSSTLLLSNPYIQWAIKIPAISMAYFTVGKEARVYTYLHHCENGITLYGFHSISQKELFLKLLKVNGIGPAAAIKILSASSEETLIKVIEEGDGEALAKLPGVGQKTAGKIILALKGELSLPKEGGEISSLFEEEFTEALCEMGFARNNVKKVVSSILSNYPAGSDFKAIEQKLFREAIVALSSVG